MAKNHDIKLNEIFFLPLIWNFSYKIRTKKWVNCVQLLYELSNSINVTKKKDQALEISTIYHFFQWHSTGGLYLRGEYGISVCINKEHTFHSQLRWSCFSAVSAHWLLEGPVPWQEVSALLTFFVVFLSLPFVNLSFPVA